LISLLSRPPAAVAGRLQVKWYLVRLKGWYSSHACVLWLYNFYVLLVWLMNFIGICDVNKALPLTDNRTGW